MPEQTCTQKIRDGICGQPAVVKMFWPNNPPLMVCAEHKEKAERIAAVMGFYLHFEDIPMNGG